MYKTTVGNSYEYGVIAGEIVCYDLEMFAEKSPKMRFPKFSMSWQKSFSLFSFAGQDTENVHEIRVL